MSAYVGSGISIYSASKSKRTKRRYEDALRQWQYTCDADGIRSLDALIADAERAAIIDGECLIRRRVRKGAVPVQLQLLEIDWLDSAKVGPTETGGRIVNGIQYDVQGRVEAYWLYDSHPGEVLATRGTFGSSPVAAADIIHYFRPTRPGQGRGITRLHSVIARARDLSLYEDAEQARKNLEARMGLVASASPDSLANPRAGADSITDHQLAAGDLGQLPSGAIVEVPPGLNLTAFEPKAAPGYVETVKLSLHLICAGLGVPYHMATGDVSQVNFSSARIRDIDFRRDVSQHQWMCTVPRLLMPLCRWLADAIELSDGTPADYAFDFTPPRWDYVNPKQDVDAERALLEAGTESLPEIIRRRGRDPEDVYRENGEAYAALESSGALKLIQLLTGKPAAPGAPQPTQEVTA